MQLKFISLNLAGYKNWKSRQQKIIEFINKTDPDVVLLQEVRFDPQEFAYSQSILINKLLEKASPYTQTTVSRFYQPNAGSAYREGLATLSKYPIISSESLVLTKRPDDKHSRIIQNIDLTIGGHQVKLANIHLSNNKYSSEQLRELLDIFSSRQESRIIAGDFNIFNLEEEKDSYAQSYISSTELKKYISFPAENLTLDYVLAPKKFAIYSFETHEGLSDHNALAFTIELPE